MTISNFGDEPNHDERIQRLRTEIEKLGGTISADPEMPAELEEEFLKQVLEFENAQSITLLRLLENAGLDVPPPESLGDRELNLKLSEVINRMASLGAYLLHTNHLSDAELYSYLYHDALREEAILFPENPAFAYYIDLTGSGSEEDNQIYLRHYADEDYRRQWAKDWADDPMPEHEEPPFDRDSGLPQSPFG